MNIYVFLKDIIGLFIDNGYIMINNKLGVIILLFNIYNSYIMYNEY